ncbi:MAG TPA: protein kinase [Polyangiaceae bacterium]|nr:protein kinase [Polyangiaceae bacterium]
MAEDAFGIVGSVIASAYHVESVVAEGGFGTVYRAHHGGFRAPVALKCLRLPPGIIHEARQQFLDSFRAEAELLFRLSASIPNVVRPLHVDAFTAADGRFVPYLVLEWLEGSTLDALIRKRRNEGQAPLPLKKAVRLLSPVARALERAHNFRGPDGSVSIVHRDIKPENIFVASVAGEEIVKILDFGIGKAKSIVSQVAGRLSQGSGSGISTFTPAYGSPEQWAPKHYGQTGPWTDVWGLALTLSETLVGHPLIDGDPAAIMGTVLDPSRRPTPGSEGVIVSDEVERVFEKALALDPRRRYADAGVFWNELLSAARITSGELQEVRLPRDARAELGGGTRVERVDMGRRPSVRPPSMSRPGLVSPPTAAPVASSAAPELRSLSPSPAPFPPTVSGSFEVPDLEVAPISRPAPQRTSSGTRQAVAPPLELDEVTGDFGAGAALDLDLPQDEPLARRISSAGMQAVRISEPPPPHSFRTPVPPPRSSYPPPDSSLSPPPVAVSAPLPPASLKPPASLSPHPAPPPATVALPTPDQKPVWHLKADPDASLAQRLLPGGLVVGGAILVTILDQVYSAVSGEIFMLAGLRTSVVAGLFMLIGVALCLYRLKRD